MVVRILSPLVEDVWRITSNAQAQPPAGELKTPSLARLARITKAFAGVASQAGRLQRRLGGLLPISLLPEAGPLRQI